MYQIEATSSQYLFNLLYWLFIVAVTYKYKDSIGTKPLVWLLFYGFCMYAYWCTDYFTYKYWFSINYFDSDHKEPVYEYVQRYSFNSYILFRTLIWGTALCLYYKTIKRYNVNVNFVLFFFSVFFLLTFSYARATLAMACYFYGLSVLINRSNNTRFTRFTVGIFFIIISYFFHRSMLPLIAVTPLCFVRFNKKMIYLSILLFPLAAYLTNRLLGALLVGSVDLGESVSGFTDAATNYAGYSNKAKNWKYMLTSLLDQSKFFVAYIYVLFTYMKYRKEKSIDQGILRLLTITTIIIYIAFIFLTTNSNGATEVIGYRYLFMSGIPLTILFGYIYNENFYHSRSLYSVIIFTGLYGFIFILGKVLSLS